MDCSLPDSSVHGISQARILEWVAIYFCRVSSQSGDQTHVSCVGRRILHHWATREALTLVTSVLLLFLHFSICNIVEDQIPINMKIVNVVSVVDTMFLVCFGNGGAAIYGLGAVNCESHWIEDRGLMAIPKWMMPGQLEKAPHPDAGSLTRTLMLFLGKSNKVWRDLHNISKRPLTIFYGLSIAIKIDFPWNLAYFVNTVTLYTS